MLGVTLISAPLLACDGRGRGLMPEQVTHTSGGCEIEDGTRKGPFQLKMQHRANCLA